MESENKLIFGTIEIIRLIHYTRNQDRNIQHEQFKNKIKKYMESKNKLIFNKLKIIRSFHRTQNQNTIILHGMQM